MPENGSLDDSLSVLPDAELREDLALVSRKEARGLEHDWGLWARPNQLPPAGDWLIWLLLAGRGFGKTRSGAEWVRREAQSGPGIRIALVGRSAADVRDVMVEGESGLLAVGPPWSRPRYEASKRRLTWSNGAIATAYSADVPDLLRGPQHHAAWCDELAAWRYPEAWDMLMFGLRLGQRPRCVVTTTPKPVKLIRELVARGVRGGDVAITRGSTYDNRDNLAPAFLSEIIRRYEGTRLGRQELAAELIEDVPGALWNRDLIDRTRHPLIRPLPALRRVVVAVDPAVSSGEGADETGIIVAALAADGCGYVLDDLSARLPAAGPQGWAARAIAAYHAQKADRIIAEKNNGGEMVEATLRVIDPGVSFRAVWASRGKVTRAEPVAALYEQGRVHHVGAFPALEDQMCAFTPDFDRTACGYSPDRVDALVWALSHLLVNERSVSITTPFVATRERQFP